MEALDSLYLFNKGLRSPRSSVETPARAPLTDSRSSGQTPARAANAHSQKFLQTGPRSSAQLPARASLTTSRSSVQSSARAANTTQDILDGCIPRSSVQAPARADKPKSGSLEGSVIDIHYYNLFSNSFNNMSVQQNIDFIYNNRSAQLNQVTASNGPLTFIGEWVAEWKLSEAAKKDYQRFGKAQLEVYGRASFGWSYWTMKNVNNHWSLKWMINNGALEHFHNRRRFQVHVKQWNQHCENSSGVVDSFRSNTPSTIRWRILKSLGQCLLLGSARKYGMKVMIDLHTAPGSQTNSAVNSSRDGFVEWGQTDQNIQETVDVIDFLTARYAKHPSLYAVELLNEPCAPCVTLEKLKKYYRAGYNAVRKHSSTAYVIMASRMQYGMKPVDPTELFPLARELKGSAIDVHYYQIFMPVFKKMNHQQNIDFVYTNTSVELNRLIKPNNPQIFIGEWSTEWGTANLAHPSLSKKTTEDYKKFGKAQLQVYGKATFGWAYWTLKCTFSHLSFEWMIKNGYLQL
ncbi:hypothetical protein HYC85_008060 [Camellia sinensis]|uniref:Glycoside hydrolase family 5 domain-containing protein n=1 Tax=Camellia sinensis TaxID=4442 RepID=A0A7J7HT39_CAMSI|nr:hypothetical protein HYC85_008060 [Camellia sinensis]